MMRGKMGWITKHIRSGCRRMKVVSMCMCNHWFAESPLKGQ